MTDSNEPTFQQKMAAFTAAANRAVEGAREGLREFAEVMNRVGKPKREDRS